MVYIPRISFKSGISPSIISTFPTNGIYSGTQKLLLARTRIFGTRIRVETTVQESNLSDIQHLAVFFTYKIILFFTICPITYVSRMKEKQLITKHSKNVDCKQNQRRKQRKRRNDQIALLQTSTDISILSMILLFFKFLDDHLNDFSSNIFPAVEFFWVLIHNEQKEHYAQQKIQIQIRQNISLNLKIMTQSTTYLGLCAKIDPPLIGVYYKSKDGKKKVYNILLHKLVFNPNVEEVTKQLYQQHPHILKEDKISGHKIAEFVRRIQIGLNIDDGQEDQYADQEFEQEHHHQPDDDDFDFQEPNAKLNRSS